jgi:hypothetical protein
MKKAFWAVLVVLLAHNSTFAAVDCTLKLGSSTRTYRRIDLGGMVGHFKLDVLQGGVLVPQKIALNLFCNGTDTTPATLCTVGFANGSELVKVGEFSRAKVMNQVEFSALTPQEVHTQIGDLDAGEGIASVRCSVQ